MQYLSCPKLHYYNCKYFASLVIFSLFLVCTVSPVQAAVDVTKGVAIIGDSSSDEYRADDNRGGSYKTTTFVWDELLSKLRSFNFGTFVSNDQSSRGEPRRHGFEYNWARSSATTNTMISSGQHSGVAQQIRDGKVGMVLIFIGNNDFAPYNNTDGYGPIYSGQLSGTALQSKLSKMKSNYMIMITTLQSAGTVPILIGSVADWGEGALAAQQFPNAAGRQKVSQAVKEINDYIKQLAQQKGLHFVDLNAMGAEAMGLSNLAALSTPQQKMMGGIPITVGLASGSPYMDIQGERFDIVGPGDEPHHIIISDKIHAGTVMNGLVANIWIQHINSSLGNSIPLLTINELFTAAGIKSTAPAPTTCRYDFNSDKKVSVQDLIILLNNFGKPGYMTSDFIQLLKDWGMAC